MGSRVRVWRHCKAMLCHGVVLLVAAMGAAFALPAAPASPVAPVASGGDALTGVLARIRQAGTVRLGYREHALPFSFAGPGKTPYGYSIDLCLAIVDEITAATGGRPLRIEFQPVTPSNRIDRVVNGEIDLECGATTNTAQRRLRVAFSPLSFVSGTRLAVPRASGLRSQRDLNGRKVAVARGTTNEEVLRTIVAKTGLHTTIVTTDDLAQAFALVAAGQADAVASDEVLLIGFLAETGQRRRYDLVGELLSYEPYGVMFARDDTALAEAVSAAFVRLAQTRELRWIYVRWFERQLPSGVRLGLPMSPQLRRAFEMIGLPPD